MAVLYTPHFVQFFDDNGNPLSGGKLYTYAAGTTTPKATYTTASGTVTHDNPVTLDSAGRAVIFLAGSYKFILHDSSDVAIDNGETDNVTAFTATGEGTEAFFYSFSGDGSQTSFSLPQDLGTDEKTLMVFVDRGLDEYSTNGAFDDDSGWTKGTGWTIGSGVATATGAISTDLEQDAAITINDGQSYTITYTITRSAGSITPNMGGTAGTARSSSGTYTETIICGSTQKIKFSTSGFTGTVDDVTVHETSPSGFQIQSPSAYTLSGTTITFTTAPPSGTNNVYVFAPSLLVGSANAAAAAADASASEAASQAAKLSGTSTTSNTISIGSKSFTTQSGKSFDAGIPIIITSDSDPDTYYMSGLSSSYSGTDLTVDIDVYGGSGTFSDWTIRVCGAPGLQGPQGATGDGSGDMLASNNLSELSATAATARANIGAIAEVSEDTTPQLAGFLDPNSHYIGCGKGADIASASPLVIGTDGDYFNVTGTTSFSAMTVAANRRFTLKFTGILTVTHGSGITIGPGGANYTTAVGDIFICQSTAADTVQVIDIIRSDGLSPLLPHTLGTPVASTSGTNIDFTGIPSGVKRVTINFAGVSTSGSNAILFQLGTSSGIETSGYLGAGSATSGGSVSSTNYTAAFGLPFGAGTNVIHGSIIFTLLSSSANSWTANGQFSLSNGANAGFSSGSKALSAVLDRVRITTVGGTDTFDAGSINIMYER